MSYILDALKKLEHDKARKERAQHGITSIAGELLREDLGRDTRRSPWVSVLLTVGVALLAAGGTWLLLKGNSSNGPNVKTSPLEMQATVNAFPVPLSPAPAALQPAAATQAVEPALSEVPRQPAVVAMHAMPPVSVGGAPEKRRHAISPDTTQPNAVSAFPQSADVKISGIAWQDERTARCAVINGYLMQEGSVVAGCRVVEIHQDRVCFSQSGRVFEVPLVAAAMSAGVK